MEGVIQELFTNSVIEEYYVGRIKMNILKKPKCFIIQDTQIL